MSNTLNNILDRKRRLFIAQHENVKRKVALDTLENLMVTLSHYLLDANMVIVGKARRCRKATSNPDVVDAASIIEEEA